MRYQVGTWPPTASVIRFRRIQAFAECGDRTAIPFVASAHDHVPHRWAGAPLSLFGS